MTKYVVTYTLPYEHVVRVGIEADTAQAAQTIAESAFNDGVLWDNTPTMPLLMDEFEETGDAGVPVLFQVWTITKIRVFLDDGRGILSPPRASGFAVMRDSPLGRGGSYAGP